MSVTIQLPEEIERQLRDADPKLDDHARDQFLIANYQAGNLSAGDVALILGFETRIEAEQWLGARGVYRNYSAADLEDDRRNLDHVLGPVNR
jgi:hypothetical protein